MSETAMTEFLTADPKTDKEAAQISALMAAKINFVNENGDMTIDDLLALSDGIYYFSTAWTQAFYMSALTVVSTPEVALNGICLKSGEYMYNLDRGTRMRLRAKSTSGSFTTDAHVDNPTAIANFWPRLPRIGDEDDGKFVGVSDGAYALQEAAGSITVTDDGAGNVILGGG